MRSILTWHRTSSVCICVHLRLILVFALLPCSAALAASTSYPVPEGAFDIGHASIRPGRTEQDHFSIRLDFPSTAVIDHYRGYFSRFIECRGRGGAWETGPDAYSQPPKFMHQLVKIWATENNREVITLSIRYTSAGAEWRDRPDNDVQNVVLLYEKVFDARQAARAKGATCDDAPPPPRRPPPRGPIITP
jgi:hypothetical protein